MGEDSRALADLDRAIAFEPQEPTYYSIKAQIYLGQGKTAEALAMLDQGIAIKPDHAQFFQDKAEVYRKQGDTKQEEVALTRLIALKPKGELGILLRAFLYEKLGKADLAIADYDALLALDPDGKFYRERRAALLKAREESAAPPVPAVVVGDAPGKSKEPERGAAPLKKADRNAAPTLECRVGRARRQSDGRRPLREMTLVLRRARPRQVGKNRRPDWPLPKPRCLWTT